MWCLIMMIIITIIIGVALLSTYDYTYYNIAY